MLDHKDITVKNVKENVPFAIKDEDVKDYLDTFTDCRYPSQIILITDQYKVNGLLAVANYLNYKAISISAETQSTYDKNINVYVLLEKI